MQLATYINPKHTSLKYTQIIAEGANELRNNDAENVDVALIGRKSGIDDEFDQKW